MYFYSNKGLSCWNLLIPCFLLLSNTDSNLQAFAETSRKPVQEKINFKHRHCNICVTYTSTDSYFCLILAELKVSHFHYGERNPLNCTKNSSGIYHLNLGEGSGLWLLNSTWIWHLGGTVPYASNCWFQFSMWSQSRKIQPRISLHAQWGACLRCPLHLSPPLCLSKKNK